MERYHIRRKDRVIEDKAELDRILCDTLYVTVAMCTDGEPYLVVLNHGYDPESKRLYFHCAPEGKKNDILAANPRVWGIAFEDLGYTDGKCIHEYRSVMFSGTAVFLEDFEEKADALRVLIRQLETNPAPMEARTLIPERLAVTGVGYIQIDEMCGKEVRGSC